MSEASEKSYSVEQRLNAWIAGGYDPVAGPPTIEDWHTLAGGLGLANLTSTHGRYRMLTNGTVEIDILLTATGAGSGTGTFANSLAAPYQPALQRSYSLQGPIAAGPARVTVVTSGAISVSMPTYASGNIFGGTIIMILD